ncbi:unnamed protein product [Toxocara canis]|uniref:TMC domain-containing protein n=1 Tax=Toxocara canis TaxID=6265 RepID=A0A183UFJ8_TOXCA|nr:unnamed protein product [Toxocara canis]
MDDSQSDAEAVAAAILSRPSVRRASVFSDLITIFRRSTSNASHHHKLYHARRPSDKDRDAGFIPESEAFLGTDASGAGINGPGDDEEEGKPMTRQVLLDKIRQKKEVIGKLRCQPWLAQKYLEQHESRVSKTHLYKEELKKRWHAACRWIDNIRIYLIPWEAKIKRIESHFGSVVSSYFTFLRWVVYVNLIITTIVVSFIVIPEMLADAAADEGRKNRTESRKVIPSKERIHADELQVVLHFDGYLKYTPLFYGYYSSDEFVGASVRYAVPLAYFVITLFVFGYSFFAILSKMAANARLSKLASGKTEQYTFNWKVFTGWDYTIGNPDTASNTVMAIIIKLRESIAECRIETVDNFQILLFLARIFANAVILGMLAFSIYVISFAVQSSQTVEKTGSLFTKNQVPTIVATITHLFPMIFDLIGKMERYHPRTALRAHLTRVLVLYVVNYLTLIIALFEKLDKIRGDEIMKIIDGRQNVFRFKRQVGELNSTLPVPPPFASRNFTSPAQARNFFNESIARFTEEQQRPSTSTAPTDTIATRTKRTTEKSLATSWSSTRRTLPHSGITIQPQYGPVGLNNPNALLFNETFLPGRRRFQTIKLGPPRLAVFTPPPTPSRPTFETNVSAELGPNWRDIGKRPKTTLAPKITVRTTQRVSAPIPRLTTTFAPKTDETLGSQKTTTTHTAMTTKKLKPSATKSSTPSTITKPTLSTTTSTSTLLTTLASVLIPSKNASSPQLPTTRPAKLLPTTQAPTSLQPKSHKKLSKVGKESATMVAPIEATASIPTNVTLNASVTSTQSPSSAPTRSSTTAFTTPSTVTTTITTSTAAAATLPVVVTASSSSKTSPTDAVLSTSEVPKGRGKTRTRPTLAPILAGEQGDSLENMVEEEFDDRRGILRDRNRSDLIETARRNDTRRKMVILSPDDEPIDVPNNITLVNLDSHDNGTFYEIGGIARMTVEEAEMEDHFCWETMIGQEIVKLVTMDLVITIASIFVIDFFRGLWIKYCSAWWCWDIETTFPEYGEFKVAENVLHIIYNQGLIWLGLFFAPLLPAMNNVKLIILLYIRGWACMTCNVPAREIFRASRGYERFYNVFTHMLEGRLDEKVIKWLRYVASPGVVIPVLLLLMLIIYFLVSLVHGLREANNDLQQQLIHERTEEKKKIFELAGGGNKKKSSEMERHEKKKKVVTYLPLVEQKRREPWRAYNGRENDSSVCLTDETSTITTPTSNVPSPLIPVRAKQSVPSQVIPKESTSRVVPAHPLGSVEEIEREESVGPSGESENEAKLMTMSKSASLAKSSTTDRVDDWFNDEEPHSDHSYEVQPDAVQLATPEEIRRLMHPLTHSLANSAVSLAGFPKDVDSSPVTVVFPTPAGAAAGSRRSSKRCSYISLYENPQEESPLTRSMRSVAMLLRDDSTGMIRLHESAISSSAPKSRPFSGYQQPSVHRSLDPIIAAEREKEIEEECTISEEEEKIEQKEPPPKQKEMQHERPLGTGRKFEPKVTSTEFLPWPSIDEMRERRSKLQPLLPQTPSTSSRPSRRTSPPKPLRTIEGSPTKDETPMTSSQQRRFRISVSPTRRFQTDLSGSDTDTSTGKRRFVIKQEIMPGSMASVATTDTARTSNAPSNTNGANLSPRAPRVQFGEDDSPRLETSADMEPKVHTNPKT